MKAPECRQRCPWCGHDPLYVAYHDNEWGQPQYDDRRLFELLTLEGAQAGLSWITILRKRDTYRELYRGFDPRTVAAFGEDDVAAMLTNSGIVRHRGKITWSIRNARAYLGIQAEYGTFSEYLWGMVNGKPIQNHWTRLEDVPATSELSERLSRDLKKRGFGFVGSTICYAFLQATGIINDHLTNCWRYPGNP